jgi:hypothetical protein
LKLIYLLNRITNLYKTMIANLENQLSDMEKKIHKLLVDINEEDSLREGHWVRRKQRELEAEFAITVKAKKYLTSKLIEYKECHACLKDKIYTMIENHLTVGRSDHDLPQFKHNEIQHFIKENDDGIEKVIEMMIIDYEKDDELEFLKDPLFSWIGEYLYEFVPLLKDEEKESWV